MKNIYPYYLIETFFVILILTIIFLLALMLKGKKRIPMKRAWQIKTELAQHLFETKMKAVKESFEIYPDNPLKRLLKNLQIYTQEIEQSQPYLKLLINELQELQGKIYLLEQYIKQNPYNITQIRDYETYLFENQWKEKEYEPLDLPPNSRQIPIASKQDRTKDI
jgi:hypothetical protein